MRSLLVFAVAAYAVIATVVFAGMQAEQDHECHHQFYTICDAEIVAQDTAISVFIAATPPGWIAALMVTGVFL